MTIESYLQRNYRVASVATYSRSIGLYVSAVSNAATASYGDIIEYLQEQRKTQSSRTVHSILQGIKKYYNYLQFVGKRVDNPAINIHLKDYKSKSPILLNSLLTKEELELVWTYFLEKTYRYQILRNRNLGMLSLLLEQGIELRELGALKLSDVDLLSGKVFIAPNATRNGRTLALAAHQILLLYNYIEQDRPKLEENQALSNALFIGYHRPLESIGYLLRMPKRKLGGKRLSAQLIRKSVLVQEFRKGKSLAAVQYFAGHKCPSSTERYQIQDLAALQQGVLKHHPLEQVRG